MPRPNIHDDYEWPSRGIGNTRTPAPSDVVEEQFWHDCADVADLDSSRHAVKRAIAYTISAMGVSDEVRSALEAADKRLCELTPSFPADVGPDMRDAEEIEKTGAVVMQIRQALAQSDSGDTQ